jgi:glycosyltransferase involved in cell wall biosynthesis
MQEVKKLPISVIIPVYNHKESLKKVLDGILLQTEYPEQIVIIDSSDVDDIKSFLVDFDMDVDIIYHKVNGLFPGEARNLGVKLSSKEYIAFLDSKTIPNKAWLSYFFDLLGRFDIIFGSVHYNGARGMQKIIGISIYGERNLEHISGTIISRENFYKIGEFVDLRAGEDIDWRNRVKRSGLRYFSPDKKVSTYTEISGNLWSHVKRSFVYQMHGAFLDIQHSAKMIFLGLFLLFLATLIPNWNALAGYDNDIFFIPHILKIYLLVLASFFGIMYLKLVKRSNALVSVFIIKLSIFIAVFLVVFYWNAGVAKWDKTSLFFVPHITKIYITTLMFLSILLRGVVLPIKRGVKVSSLFPFKWLGIGLVGMVLDMSKAPGYLFGAFIIIYRRSRYLLMRIIKQ